MLVCIQKDSDDAVLAFKEYECLAPLWRMLQVRVEVLVNRPAKLGRDFTRAFKGAFS
jgi:hypothetical protein